MSNTCNEIYRVGGMAETILELKKHLKKDPLSNAILDSALTEKLLSIRAELTKLQEQLWSEIHPTLKEKAKIYLVPKESSDP